MLMFFLLKLCCVYLRTTQDNSTKNQEEVRIENHESQGDARNENEGCTPNEFEDEVSQGLKLLEIIKMQMQVVKR